MWSALVGWVFEVRREIVPMSRHPEHLHRVTVGRDHGGG